MKMARLLSPLLLLSGLLSSPGWSAQAPNVNILYETDFTTLGGWTPSGGSPAGYSWNADATPASAGPVYNYADHPPIFFFPYTSAPASLNFNNGTWIGGPAPPYFAAVSSSGSVTSPAIDLSLAAGTPMLRFRLGAFFEWDTALGDTLSMTIRSATTGDSLLSLGSLGSSGSFRLEAWAPRENGASRESNSTATGAWFRLNSSSTRATP